MRAAAGLLMSLTLLAAGSACGFDVQTNRPYTPAEGVNYNVGNPPVSVRNLLIISREDGQGFLSATMTTTQNDSLTSVAGTPIKPDYTPGAPFTVRPSGPVALSTTAITVLTNRPLITLQSADLYIGGEAELTLTFSTAGTLTTRVPVVDGNEQPYATISPSASGSE